MRRISLVLAAVVAMVPSSSLAQQAGPYKVLQTVKVGGEGGFDYVYADDAARTEAKLLGLQIAEPGTVLKVRKLEIKKLSAK